MATKYEYRVSSPGVAGGRLVINNDGMLDMSGDADPDEAGQLAYVDGVGFRAYGPSGVITLGSGGGGGVSGDLDGVYSNGQSITLDQGAITLTDATSSTANSLVLVKSGAGSGNVLDLGIDAALTGNAIDIDMNLGIAAKGIYIDDGAGARTGADIDVKDDSTGAHSVINIASSGAGASVGLAWTDSYAGSDASFGAKLTLSNSAGIDATVIQIVRGTGLRTVPAIDINDASTGSGDLIDVDLTGILTGDIMSFASSAAATGNVWHATMTNAVAMTALRIEGAGARTQPFIELIGTQTGTASMIDISCDGAFTGKALDIDLTTAVGAQGLLWTTAGARTAAIETVTLAGTFSATGGGTLMDINVAQTGADASPLFDIDLTSIYTGNIFDFATSAASTGTIFEINMTTAVAAKGMNWTTAGTRTVDLWTITDVGAGAADLLQITSTSTRSGHMFNVDIDSVFTGNVLDITYGTAAATGEAISIVMGTNVAGSALVLTGAGVRTDDLIKIDDGSTGNSHIFDINLTAAYTGNVIDISTGNTTVAAIPLQITRGTGTNTGSSIKIDDTGTTSVPTIDINISGVNTGNVLDVTFSAAAGTGNAIDLNMGTNVAGNAIDITSAATGVTGNGAAININGSGSLVAGADLVAVRHATGTLSSTSNLLALEAATNGTSGSFALYIDVPVTGIEAIKVDSGTVTFDETLTVAGATTLSTVLYKNLTEVVTATNIITAAESGSVFFLNSAAEFVSTLPVVAAGLNYTFIVTAAPSGASYTVVTDSSANIIVGKQVNVAGAAGDSGSTDDTITFVDGQAVTGDMVKVYCDGTNWFAYAICAVAAGITFTTVS